MIKNKNTSPKRINLPDLFRAFLATFDVNKGFIHTYRLLLAKPGAAIRIFLLRNRKLLTSPIRLMLVSTAFAAFLTLNILPNEGFKKGLEAGSQLGTEQAIAQQDTTDEKALKKIEKRKAFEEQLLANIYKYYNIFILLFIPFIALFTFLFFKKSGYYYAEHFVLNSYIMSVQNLLYLLLAPLIYFQFDTGIVVYMILSFAYFFYAAYRFFQLGKWAAFWRALLALILGYICYMIFMMIGLSIYTVMHLIGQ